MGKAAMNKYLDEQASTDPASTDKALKEEGPYPSMVMHEELLKKKPDLETSDLEILEQASSKEQPNQARITDGDSSIEKNALDKRLLSVLICPSCRSPLRLRPHLQELHCKAEGVAFPIRSGVPIMMIEAIRKLSVDEKLKRE